MPDSPLFFQIGFNRCGTTAIAYFFKRSGIPAVHYDRGRLALRMRENLAEGRDPISGYEQYQAITNMDYFAERDFFDGSKEFPALLAYYGDRARFILNTRPLEHWIRSLRRHRSNRPVQLVESHYRWRYGTTNRAIVEEHWREDWRKHHERVQREIPAEQLLVFDIESDPPEKLCEFAGLPLSCARFYRKQNPSLNWAGRLVARRVPTPVKWVLPEPLRLAVKNLLEVRR